MQIEYQTDVGQRRTSNQDAVGLYLNKNQVPFAIVADGMGGHQAGDIASRQAISFLGALWELTFFSKSQEHEEVVQWLIRSIQQANNEIYKRAQQDEGLMGMGTTIVGVVALGDNYIITNVGDSRCYLVRSEKIRQITEDHSLVNILVQQGEISPEAAVHHPRKNVLTRSVGMLGDLDVDVTDIEALKGDYLLLCSDGLTNMIEDQQILEIIQEEKNIKKSVKKLVDAANEAGGTDNITVLLLKNDGKAEVTTND